MLTLRIKIVEKSAEQISDVNPEVVTKVYKVLMTDFDHHPFPGTVFLVVRHPKRKENNFMVKEEYIADMVSLKLSKKRKMFKV